MTTAEAPPLLPPPRTCHLRFNGAEALVYVGGPSAAVLLVASVFWEDMGPGAAGWGVILSHPRPFGLAILTSFLVNLSCFFAIQLTSSLTFKVAGCTKNVFVVWYGMVMHHDRVTVKQVREGEGVEPGAAAHRGR